MAHNRTDLTASTQKGFQATVDYLKDQAKHPGQDISQYLYLGFTSEHSFVEDVSRRKNWNRQQSRYRGGKTAKGLSLWPINRQPHGVKLTPKQWAEFDEIFRLVLGPGVIAQIRRHIHQKPKRGQTEIGGPEENIVLSGYKKLGPFIVPFRTSDRSFRRELIRASDQMVRRWNRDRNEEHILEMPERREQLREDRPTLAQLLAQQEVENWLKTNPSPTSAEVFHSPELKHLRNGDTAKAALRDCGFEILTAQELGIHRKGRLKCGRMKKVQLIPEAKHGFWWVRHPEWDKKRRQKLEERIKGKEKARRKPKPKRRAQILIDGVLVLVEARAFFIEKLRELELEWQQKQEAEKQKAAVKSIKSRTPGEVPAVSIGSPSKLKDSADKSRELLQPLKLPLIIPLNIIIALERNQRPPFTTTEEATEILSRINCPVLNDQSDPQILKLGGFLRDIGLPRNDFLAAVQLALIRGAILRHGRMSQAKCFISDLDAVPAGVPGNTSPLDPFHRCWRRTFELLADESYREAWYDALVAADAPRHPAPVSAVERSSHHFAQTAAFYGHLVQSAKIPVETASVLTALHFRTSTGSFAGFLNSLRLHLLLNGIAEPKLPRLQAGAPTVVLRKMPSIYRPLPEGPTPPSPFEIEQKPQPAPVQEKKPPQKVIALKKISPPLVIDLSKEKPKGKTVRRKKQVQDEKLPEPTSDYMLSTLVRSITAKDNPPASVETLQQVLTKAGFTVHTFDHSDQAITIDDGYYSDRIGVDTLQRAIKLAIVNANLPDDASTRSPDRLAFNAKAPSQDFDVDLVNELLGNESTQWDRIKAALRPGPTMNHWSTAFRSTRDMADSQDRAVTIHSKLVNAGVERKTALVLVLSQLGARVDLIGPVLNQISAHQSRVARDVMTRILSHIPVKDTPPQMEELGKFAHRAEIAYLGPDPEGEEHVILRFGEDLASVSQWELGLAIALEILNLRLPPEARRPKTETISLGSPSPSHHHTDPLARRLVESLDDHWGDLVDALTNPEVMADWNKAFRANQPASAEDRAVQLYKAMTASDVDDSVARLMAFSQVPPTVDAWVALEQKLQGKVYE